MNRQFSIGTLFRWTTLVCLVLGVAQRILREPLHYDRITAFLIPFYDILWLTGYDNSINWNSNTNDIASTFSFGIGCILSVALHILCLVVGYCLIFGWNKK